MKIIDITTFLVHVGGQNSVFVKVLTSRENSGVVLHECVHLHARHSRRGQRY
jgi:hypothetical protein